MLDAPREPAPGLLLPLGPTSDTTEAMPALGEVSRKDARFWRQRRMRVALVAAAVVLLALAGNLAAILIGNQIVYTGARARTGNLAVVVHASGKLTAPTYPVVATVTGTLDSLSVSVGQQVTAGQALGQVSVPLLSDAVDQAQGVVASAQTTVADAVVLQTAAQDDASSANTAAWHQEQAALYACKHPVGTPPPNCEEVAIAQYNAVVAHSAAQVAQAQASVDSAQTQLTTANGALSMAQRNLAATTLAAPHAGTVTAIDAHVGATVGPGASGVYAGSGPLITIVDLTAMQVRTQVTSIDAQQVRSGQAVAFTAAVYPKHVFRGTVRSVAPVASVTPSGIAFPVTVDVDMLSGQGASAAQDVPVDVTIYLAQRYNAVLVPVASVAYAQHLLAGILTARKGAAKDPEAPTAAAVRRAFASANQLASQELAAGAGQGSSDKLTADVLVARGKHGWVLKPVLLGLSDGKSVVVQGLHAGDTVTTGQHTLAAASASTTSSASTEHDGDTPRLFGS